MLEISAKMIEHSTCEKGIDLVTMEVVYPHFIHGEVMTHRVFSRNASSSRAIPIIKRLKQVWNNPAIPIHWGANQKGMQAAKELSPLKRAICRGLWKLSGKLICIFVYIMAKLGLHKQVANRLLEPWVFMHVLISATDWDNFFELRIDPDAQPEIYVLAKLMKQAIDESVPTYLKWGEWHLPYVTEQEKLIFNIDNLLKISTARCCRVSYSTHVDRIDSVNADIFLHDRLVASRPIHASPTEHQAKVNRASSGSGNFRGWIQYRAVIENKFQKEL